MSMGEAPMPLKMPTTAILLIIATLLPLFSFTILVFVGKRMGKPLAGIVATAAIGISFVLSLIAMIPWATGEKYTPTNGRTEIVCRWGEHPINIYRGWVPSGIDAKHNTSFLTEKTRVVLG